MKTALVILTTLLLTHVSPNTTNYRLPKNVLPSFYNITTDVDIDFHKFKGYTEITVDVLEETNYIIVHAVELTFLNINIIFNGIKSNVTQATLYDQMEFLVLHFVEYLQVGQYILEFSYQGAINHHMRGLYATNYSHADGYWRDVAMTQFQTADARRTFPCFDEPALKANFSISVIRDEEHFSTSNMPLVETVALTDGRFRDSYETTPKMSTYLVAFTVNNFGNVSYPKGHIYTDPRRIQRATYAAEISDSIIIAFEIYLEMELPLKKLDMIALRHLSGGAMENWGLIAYYETKFLYSEGKSGRSAKQGTFLIIAHECAHQWLGNLVSPGWWNYLWINEGFAKLLQYIVGDELMPLWRLKEQVAIIGMRDAILVDSLERSRALSTDPETPKDFENFFDKITYDKATALLLTLYNALGGEVFKNSTRLLLNIYQYSSVTGEDIWNVFQRYLDKCNLTETLLGHLSIPIIMSRWENQSGIPVLNVSRQYNSGSVEYRQERFLLKNKSHNIQTKWYIPINIATKSNADFNNTRAITWLEPSSKSVGNYRLHPQDWFIVNKQSSYYYLVNYDERNWKLIISALDSNNFGQIPPLTRAKLLHDAFTLARSGRLNYSIALDLTKYLRREIDYIVFNSFFYVFDIFYRRFSAIDNFHLIQAHMADALQLALEHLGIEEDKSLTGDEQHIDTLNRIQIIKWSCLFGNLHCRNLTVQKLVNISEISVDLKEVIVCGGLRGADTDLWNKVLEQSMYEAGPAAELGLGCIENKESLEIYVKKALERKASVFDRIYQHGSFGANFVLDYLMEHLNETYETLQVRVTSNVITGISKFLFTKEQLSKLEDLSSNSSISDLQEAFTAAITKVKSNINWVDQYSDDVGYWIKKELSNEKGIDESSSTTVSTIIVLFIVLIIMGLIATPVVRKYIRLKFKMKPFT